MTDKRTTHVPTDEINSTFQQTGDVEYNGTHTAGTPDGVPVAADKQYQVNELAETLEVLIRYYVDDTEVNRSRMEYDLTDDGEHVEHSGETIEAFCRSHHSGDPQSDIKAAMDEI